MELLSNCALSLFALLCTLWLLLWCHIPQFRQPHGQSWWNFVGYATMTCLGLYALYDAAIFYGFLDVRKLLFASSSSSAVTSEWMLVYAQTQCVWYMTGLCGLLFERSAKDYYVMLVHHVCATSVIVVAFTFDYYTHMATLVMALHDISDIFLHAAKIMKHSTYPAAVVDAMFGVFAVVFFLTRLVVYPQILLWSMWGRTLNDGGPDMSLWSSQMLALGNGTLMVLHAYWFALIVKMLVVFARKGHVPDDVRDVAREDKRK